MKFLMNIFPGFIEHQGYLAIWLLMSFECFLPIFPSELILPLGVQGVMHGTMNIWGVAIAGVVGSMTGALIWYALAYRLGIERFSAFVTRYGRVTTMSHREVAMLQRWFDKYGAVVVFVGRLIPGIRSAVSIPAGLTHMPFITFFLYSLCGAAIWTGALTYASWLLRFQIQALHRFIGPVVTLIVIGLALIWLYRVVRHRPDPA